MLIKMREDPQIAQRDLTSLRAINTGGAAIQPALVRDLELRLKARVAIAYGLTEFSPSVTQARLSDTIEDKALTVGQPLPNVEVKIVDPVTRELVRPGIPGEVCVRGNQTMLGYHKMPDATAAMIDTENWLHTGDICSMDERGYLRFATRISDMIKRGGESIYPREIEEVLTDHPSVADVAVVGVPDELWGEVSVAFVVTKPGETFDQESLRQFVRSKLAPYKVPQYWEQVDSLPITQATMKVQKRELAQRFLQFRAPNG
jgi:fatty-acyl-CoA synthase